MLSNALQQCLVPAQRPARASKALTEIIIPVYMYDIINIIIAIKTINIVKKLYQYSWLEENSPNAIPSFQTKIIFRYFDENISEPKNFLSKLIT